MYLLRGRDREWKISAQIVEVQQSYNGKTRGEDYGENCQVPLAWPGSVWAPNLMWPWGLEEKIKQSGDVRRSLFRLMILPWIPQAETF